MSTEQLQSTHDPDPEQEYVLGIDEAGRGPILGPMVYACAYHAKTDTAKFSKLGFMDSKQLTEDKRDQLFEKIKASTNVKIGWHALVLSAEELSHKMLNTTRVSLNEISHDAAMNLIELTLKKGFKVTEVYVDTVGDPEKYRRKLRYKFPEIDITVSKKADSLYASVSAASICAKVTRDHVLAHWQFTEKNLNASTEFGSGYPSDPKTKQWIKENIDKVFGFPNLVRFSWKPCHSALDKHAHPVKWTQFDESDGDETQQRLSFSTRYRFYTENNMDIVNDF